MISNFKNAIDNFENFLNELQDFILVAALDGKIIFKNKSLLESKLLVGNSIHKIKIYKNNKPYTLAELSTTDPIKKIEPIYFEKNKNISFALRLSRLKENPDALIFTFSPFVSILNLQENLYKTESKFKFLMENLIEGILMMDNEGNILDFNKRACEIYGHSNFIGMKIFDLFPQNTIQENKTIWKNFIKTGEIKGFYKYTSPQNNVSFIDFKATTHFLPNINLATFTNETYRRRTEIALTKSESNLNAIFESTTSGIVLVNAEFEIIKINKKAKQFFQSIVHNTPQIGNSILSCFPNKDKLKNVFHSVLKSKAKKVIEEKVISLENHEDWYIYTFNPIVNNNGNVINIHFSIEKITERKLAELSLKESEEKFRSLSENSPDIIYIIDLEKRKVIYFNKNEILGFKKEYLTYTEAWINLVHPADFSRIQQHWEKFIRSNSNATESIEYRIRNKNGDYEWVSNRHMILEKSNTGKAKLILLNMSIITERIYQQEEIKKGEQRLKALIENTKDLVWSIDSKLNLTTFNKAFKDIIQINFNKKIEIGDNIYEKLNKIAQDGWLALHLSALTGNKITAETSWVDSAKNTCYYELSYNPIYNATNQVTGVSIFARDISQRKAYEATIIQTNFELDSFVYRASHDLRAPLRSILGLVNIINDDTNEVNRLNYIKLIEKSASKLDNFISDLINYSRNNRATIEVEEINFKEIIEECIENLKYMENANRIAINYSIRVKSKIYSDKRRINIFMNNIISNAIKYQNFNRKSTLKIAITRKKNNTTVILADNGIGIKKEYLAKIFNMFFRASELSYGSGLGLYISKQSVEKIGGEIKVQSKLGVGTTFTITFPDIIPNVKRLT